jgi:drug/metabolite transporter (DMT)-like permease
MPVNNMWIFLSLISAFTLATSDAFTKKALSQNDEYLVALSRLVFALPVLVALIYTVPVPVLDMQFYIAFGCAVPLEIIALILYTKALKVSPMGLTLPFLAFTPIFLIGVSYFIVGEQVSLQGAIGIVVLATGSYTLNRHEMKRGIFEPLIAIARERGSVMMIGAAIIYSFTSSLGKLAIEHSSPLFFGASYFIVLALLFTPIALWKGREYLKGFVGRKSYLRLVVPGMLFSVMILTHMIAINQTKVAYMISVKRTSLLMGVIYGYLLFRETHVAQRLTGTVLMCAGFVLIVTAP